jgi:hypothetical protein
MYKWTFSVSSSTGNGATTTNYKLYAYTDSSYNNLDTSFTTDGLINYGGCVNQWGAGTSTTAYSVAGAQVQTAAISDAGGTGIVQIFPDKGTTCQTATTTYKVPSGETRYFKLVADASRVVTISNTNEYINVNLQGDGTYTNQPYTMLQAGATAGVDFDTNDDFIWSPNSTSTTNAIADLDWANGYGILTNNLVDETLRSNN